MKDMEPRKTQTVLFVFNLIAHILIYLNTFIFNVTHLSKYKQSFMNRTIDELHETNCKYLNIYY